MKRIVSLLALGSLFGLAPLKAPAEEAKGKVAVYVSITRPAGVTDARLNAEFTRAIPVYAQVPGLERKYFTYTQTGFGGLYLFETEAAAKAHFNAAWLERVQKTYGVKASPVYFSVPAVTAGASQATPSEANVATIVEVKAPWYASDARIKKGLKDAVPTYATTPHLIYKYFTQGADRSFGGIYLWEDQASAEAHFGPAWHARVTKKYGHDGVVTFLKAPVTLIQSDKAEKH
ncbi:YdhR family protein [Aquidulcibacter paucihalophilus]|uniref:YdhR family protein n=1 Tax=Aquidulcibacter paucihalophilus TaxID=1978549 RepID=UPI000A198FE7|nr:YdhR family protein [Aquidulcibacter paucihalophilus]